MEVATELLGQMPEPSSASLGAEKPFGNPDPSRQPRSPVHGARLRRTLMFSIISSSVIGFLLNLFAWFVLQCVPGNILHLCILITVKFEDKNLVYAGSCFQWGRNEERKRSEGRC